MAWSEESTNNLSKTVPVSTFSDTIYQITNLKVKRIPFLRFRILKKLKFLLLKDKRFRGNLINVARSSFNKPAEAIKSLLDQSSNNTDCAYSIQWMWTGILHTVKSLLLGDIQLGEWQKRRWSSFIEFALKGRWFIWCRKTRVTWQLSGARLRPVMDHNQHTRTWCVGVFPLSCAALESSDLKRTCINNVKRC